MRRQLISVVLVAVIMAGGALQVRAAEGSGEIRVVLSQSGKVTLYPVGEPAEDGYRIGDDLGGGFVKGYDAQSPELAQWLAEQVSSGGWEQVLDEGDAVAFEGLQEGLYLLVQSQTAEGYIPVRPFLIPIPCDGMWEVTAKPKTQQILTESPKTGQHPAPLLGAMGIVLSGLGLAACVEKIRKKR